MQRSRCEQCKRSLKPHQAVAVPSCLADFSPASYIHAYVHTHVFRAYVSDRLRTNILGSLATNSDSHSPGSSPCNLDCWPFHGTSIINKICLRSSGFLGRDSYTAEGRHGSGNRHQCLGYSVTHGKRCSASSETMKRLTVSAFQKHE
eukprot:3823360-Pleurochrysis_carterae.AAC.2